MKRILVSVSLIATAAVAGVRVYNSEPYKDLHRTAASYVSQSFSLTCDSFLWAEVFLGDEQSHERYEFDIRDSATDNLISQAVGYTPDAFPGYSFVRLPMHPAPSLLPMPKKGSRMILKVTHTSGDHEVPFYYDNRNNYGFGRLTYDDNICQDSILAARIEGLVWNNPEMIGTYEWVPCQLSDTMNRHYYHTRETHVRHGCIGDTYPMYQLDSLRMDAACMEAMGVRSLRYIANWTVNQPCTTDVDSFNWTYTDSAWLALAQHHIHPSNMMINTGGVWPIDTIWPWGSNYYYDGVDWPTNMYDPVTESFGDNINSNNHLAWYIYNFARRYGPRGQAQNGQATGVFWDSIAPSGTPYLPLQYVECQNEPSYIPYFPWWHDETGNLRDTVVENLRRNGGDRVQTAVEVCGRFCEVVQKALNVANNSIKAEVYCPFYDNAGPVGVPDVWLEYISNTQALQVCSLVVLHSHDYPDAEWAEQRVDSLYHILGNLGIDHKTITIGAGGISGDTWPWPNPERRRLRTKYYAESYIRFWARNANPLGPIPYYNWQGFSDWGVHKEDNCEIWGLVKDDFSPYQAGFGLQQLTSTLSGRAFNRRIDSVVGGDTVHMFEFEDQLLENPRRTWVAWKTDHSASDDPLTVRLPVRTDELDVVELPTGEAPSQPNHLQAGTDGYYKLGVGKWPVYVIESPESLDRPDLVALDIQTQPEVPRPGVAVHFAVWVKNQGTAASQPISNGGAATFYVNDNPVAQTQSMPGIPKDGLVQIGSDGTWIFPITGECLVKAVVNPEPHAFNELTFDNNTGYKHYRVIFPQQAEIDINPGGPPGGVTLTNVPRVILRCNVTDSLMGYPESLSVTQFFYPSLTDTLPAIDCFGRTEYRSDQLWPLAHGQGKYRLSVQFMRCLPDTGCPKDTSLVLTDSVIADWSSPTVGSIVVNHGSPLTGSALCSLIVSATDSGLAGLGQIRCGNRSLVQLLVNPGFDSNASGWTGNHYVHDSAGVIELPMSADDSLFFYQNIPLESLAPRFGRRLRLSADVVSDSLMAPGGLEFQWHLGKFNSSVPGPDTLWLPWASAGVPIGYWSMAGIGNLRTDFDLNPPPPMLGYGVLGGRAGFFFHRKQGHHQFSGRKPVASLFPTAARDRAASSRTGDRWTP
jgi:hypothetical protein